MDCITSTTPWLLLCLQLAAAAAVLFLFLKITSSSSGRRRRLPPGPKPLPIVGNLLDLGDNPNQSLARLAKIHGPVMSLRLGAAETVVISSPEAAREVLQTHDAVLSNRSVPDSIRAVAHDAHSMVWISAGSQWRRLRRISNTHLLSPQRLDAYEDVRCWKVREAVHYIADCSAAGSPIDVGRVAFTTALNLISRTVFSCDMADLYGESSQVFKNIVEEIMLEIGRPNISDFFPFLAGLDLQGVRRRAAANIEKLHSIFDEQIDQRIISNNGKDIVVANDLLDALLQSKIQEDESKSERLTLKSLLLDIFVAGTDTSSSTVEWAMAELIRSPLAMAKARDEIARVIGFETELKESDINDLPYLQAVVKETLRLHPPTPFLIPRKADAAVEIAGGYQVPKGTRLIVNAWAIGRDGDVWKDPEQFTPERFVGSEVSYRGRHFELIPFGGGRRICPGLPLAFRMVHLMVGSMVQKFEWSLPEGKKAEEMDMSEKFGITLAMASPLKLIAVSH